MHVRRINHAGLVRLPDVPVRDRIALMAEVLQEHREALESRSAPGESGSRTHGCRERDGEVTSVIEVRLPLLGALPDVRQAFRVCTSRRGCR